MNNQQPPIRDFVVDAIKRLRRNKLPSAVRANMLWEVVKIAGYSAKEYQLALTTLLNDETIFCYGIIWNSKVTREQRITSQIASNFDFTECAENNCRFIHFSIFADGLTNEGTRAMNASRGGNAFLIAQEILSRS